MPDRSDDMKRAEALKKAEEWKKLIETNKEEALHKANELTITGHALPTLFGWPSTGGVWVLNPTESQWKEYNKSPVTTDKDQDCRALQQLGATFYSDPDDCEEAKAWLAAQPPRG
ncbi:hypothetical protein F66182_11784 [Fusarium sp. NRRL 66182]|nr:hypothetical protein F66182_11784 [Fusarium sp. NRRL 66182]